VLDLDCRVIYEADSIQKATQYITGKNVQYSSHNSGRRFYSEYMIATKEFYNSHPEEVDKWRLKHLSRRKYRISKLYNKLKRIEDKIILMDYEGEILEFESVSATAKFLGISRQLVENRAKGRAKKNIYNIRYKNNPIKPVEISKPVKKDEPVTPIILKIEEEEMQFSYITEIAEYLKITPGAVHRAIKNRNLRDKRRKPKYDIRYKYKT